MPKARKLMHQTELSKILKDHHKKMRKDPLNSDFLVIKNRDLSNLVVSSKYYDLPQIKFINCDLIGLHFDNFILNKAVFSDCDLSFTNFSGASMQYTFFENCNLSLTDFREADLSYSTLNACEYDGTDFSKCNLIYVNFQFSSSFDFATCFFGNTHISMTSGLNAISLLGDTGKTAVGTFGSHGRINFFPDFDKVFAGCWSGTFNQFEEIIKESFTGTDDSIYFNLDVALMISEKHNPKKEGNGNE